MAYGSKKGACSSNTQEAKGNCLEHNRRDQKKKPSYINEQLSKNNRTVFEDEMIRGRKSIVPLRKAAEKLYTEKTGQKCQKSFAPFREACLKIKEGVTDEQLMEYKQKVEALTGWKVIGIWVHEDEGYAHSKYIEGDDKFEINHHAHVLFDCQNHETGKAIRCDKKILSRMQDVLAESTGMERGNYAAETGRRHRSAMQERIIRQEERIEELQHQVEQLSVKKEVKEQTIEGIKSFFGASAKDKTIKSQGEHIKAQEEQIKAQEEQIHQLMHTNRLINEKSQQKQKDLLSKAKKAIDEEKQKSLKNIKLIEAMVMKQKEQIGQLVEILKKKSPSLAAAAESMIAFIKGGQEHPNEQQRSAVNRYLAETHCDTGVTPKDTVDRRKIGVQDISIASINVCTPDELRKMDTALDYIATMGPDEISPYKDISLHVRKLFDGKFAAKISYAGITSDEFVISQKEGYLAQRQDYEGRKMREKIMTKVGTPDEIKQALLIQQHQERNQSRGFRR